VPETGEKVVEHPEKDEWEDAKKKYQAWLVDLQERVPNCKERRVSSKIKILNLPAKEL